MYVNSLHFQTIRQPCHVKCTIHDAFGAIWLSCSSLWDTSPKYSVGNPDTFEFSFSLPPVAIEFQDSSNPRSQSQPLRQIRGAHKRSNKPIDHQWKRGFSMSCDMSRGLALPNLGQGKVSVNGKNLLLNKMFYMFDSAQSILFHKQKVRLKLT